MRLLKCLLVMAVMLGSAEALAADKPALTPEKQLAACLKRAEQSPDIALAETDRWIKDGGGDRAQLCHAFAEFHRGEYLKAAQQFALLAAARDTKDKKHAASLHAQAGLSYMRAGDHKNAENEYAIALRLEPQDPEIWLDRATERATAERYWDAVEDLNAALKIMPDMPEAYHLRAQAWMKLGNESSAKADFEHEAALNNGETPN